MGFLGQNSKGYIWKYQKNYKVSNGTLSVVLPKKFLIDDFVKTSSPVEIKATHDLPNSLEKVVVLQGSKEKLKTAVISLIEAQIGNIWKYGGIIDRYQATDELPKNITNAILGLEETTPKSNSPHLEPSTVSAKNTKTTKS